MRKTLAYAAVLIMLMTSMAGCNRPAKKPAPQKHQPRQQVNKIRKPDRLITEPTISLYINETGEKKYLKIEEYLPGVIAAEMDPNSPEAALEAQAIIARTFTYKKKLEGGVKEHNTDASTNTSEFQAYTPNKINLKMQRAVEKTRGIVIKYKDNLVEAYFNADNGGVTASPSEGLAIDVNAPYLKAGIKDESIKASPPDTKSWTAKIPLVFATGITWGLSGKNPGNINNVEILKKGPSGRAEILGFNKIGVSAPKFRLAVGSDKMRSTLISDIYIDNGMLVIKGRGRGHGVGLSQDGAVYWANKGKSSQDIINFYYKDITYWQLWK